MRPYLPAIIAALLVTLSAGAAETPHEAAAKPRIIVLTDISNEPDDEESLVRFLVYAYEFDVEALIATTSTHLKNGTRKTSSAATSKLTDKCGRICLSIRRASPPAKSCWP